VFLVDLAVRTNVAPAAESDNLGDALDLSALADTLQEVVGGESRALLEFLAVQSAREILRRFPAAQEVHLRLAKPNPPGIDAAEEAVSIELSR
jgi:dihydroneopterin aldolase